MARQTLITAQLYSQASKKQNIPWHYFTTILQHITYYHYHGSNHAHLAWDKGRNLMWLKETDQTPHRSLNHHLRAASSWHRLSLTFFNLFIIFFITVPAILLCLFLEKRELKKSTILNLLCVLIQLVQLGALNAIIKLHEKLTLKFSDLCNIPQIF